MTGLAPTGRHADTEARPSRWSKVVPVIPAEVAPVGRRVLALLVDQAVALIVVGSVFAFWGWLGHSPLLGLWLAVLVMVVTLETAQSLSEAISGATLGEALVKIRTVSASTGWPAGLLVVLERRLLLLVAGIVLPVVGAYLVALSGLWDRTPARRGWHDRITGALVLRAWAVPSLEDRERLQASRKMERARHRDEPLPEVPPVAPRSVAEACTHGPFAEIPAESPAVQPNDELEPSRDLPDPELWGPPALLDADIRATGSVTEQMLMWPIPHPHTPPDDAMPVPSPWEPPTASTMWECETEPYPPPEELELTRQVETPLGARIELVFDTGERVRVCGTGAVGRDLGGIDPLPRHPVVIRDPARSVSRLHLRFGLENDRTLWVTDQHSTNGTILIDPNGRVQALPTGGKGVVGIGWRIKFGDRFAEIIAVPALNSPNLVARSR